MKEQCLIKGSGRSKWELVLEVVLATKFSTQALAAKGKRETYWWCKFMLFHLVFYERASLVVFCN